MSLLSAALEALVEPSRRLGRPGLPQRLLDVIVPARVGGRRAWAADGRAAIEARGIQSPAGGPFAAELEQALEGHSAVGWAKVNAPLGRVIIGLTVDPAPLEDLVAVVDRVEARFRPDRSADEPDGQSPVDSEPIERAAVELVADIAGIGAALLARGLRVGAVPAELAAAVSVVDSTPRLRGFVERALGASTADTVLAVANAAVQALAQGFVGLGVDGAQRALVLAEAAAAAAAWRAGQGRYLASADTAASGPMVVERPALLRAGPVEEWADAAGALGLSAFGVALPAFRDGWRAAGLALSVLPKAGRAGREAFAAQLGRMLSGEGAIILDPESLRRLDRVSAIVIDADLLRTDRWLPGVVQPLTGADHAEVADRVHALFRGKTPQAVRREGRWALGPIDELAISGRRGVRERRRFEADGVQVLGLARGARLMAVVGVVPEQHESLGTLAAACRHSGGRVVVAGDAGGLEDLGADVCLPGAGRLLATVRSLQADGSGVLLVSARGQAVAGADVGVGVDRGGRPAWGGHILVGPDLGLAARLIDACAAARRVSLNSVRLARAGTAVGAIAAVMSGTRAGAYRSLLAVNAAAAVALALGAGSAARLARGPVVPAVSHVQWHAIPPEAVMQQLGSSKIHGLNPDRVHQLQSRSGSPTGAPVSFPEALMEELANPLTPILGAGAALSAAIGAVVDGALIVGVTMLSAVMGSAQRRHTDRALNALLGRSALIARTVRSGMEQKIPGHELVPGDLIQLASGDVVPADCRIIESTGLEIDESSLTGEAFPVAKSEQAVIADTPAERSSMVYEGTTVAAGSAKAVVVAVGNATEAGRSAAAAREGPQTVGVERRLAAITHVTAPVTLASAAAVITAGLARGIPFRETAGAGVSLAVAAVPEGLPFLVSAAQMASARRLSVRNALVRNPRAVEALGRVNVLCFDKTGTLTEGRIRLAAVATADGDPIPLARLTRECRQVLAAGLRATPEPRHGRKLEHFTDRAVTRGGRDAGVTRTDYAPDWRAGLVLPFEPSRGYHASVGVTGRRRLLSIKGAPETVIPRCSLLRGAGADRPIDAREVRRLNRQIDLLAGRGYRILAVAERTAIPDGNNLDDEMVSDLTLTGFLALSDPVRATAAASVTALRDAGVQVIMITGDHPGTASAVAGRLALVNGGRIVTGNELDRLDDEALDRILPSVTVVARGTPAHKVRVIRSFQRLGRTVAMTGDGANDAPAIRLADVGIALGRRGTPAARAAADLVVTDDRLETIISAMIEGRSMWGSVREALGILVGGNLGEIAFTVLGAVLTGLSPLGARQLLLVNLLTDLAPALAVALRPPHAASTQTLLAEGPEASLGSALARAVASRAFVTALGAGAAWLTAAALGLGAAASTIALAGLVGTQLAQTLVSGTPTPGVLLGGLGSLAVLAAVIQIPVLSTFFGCVPLGAAGWAIAAAAAAGATALSTAVPWILAVLQQVLSPQGRQRPASASVVFA